MKLPDFASTGLEVFPLGMGTVQLGMAYGVGMVAPPSDSECVRVLRLAHDSGINYYDTAPSYERSELVVGKAFSALPDKPIIATKVMLPPPAEIHPSGLQQIIEVSLTASMRALGLEQIVVMQVHNLLAGHLVDELFTCMERLTGRGLVRFWGATVYEEVDAAQIVASGRFNTLQVPFSILDQRMSTAVFPAGMAAGMGLVFRSVFLKGILTHRYADLPEELAPLRARVARLDTVAREAGVSLAELAFRFAAFAPFGQVTLFGSSSAAETTQNLELLRRGPLADDLIAAIAALDFDEELLAPVYSTMGWGRP